MSDSPHDTYQSPLASRYASDEMQRIWSARHKFQTWRRIWLAVAKAQHEVTKEWETPLVTPEQVAELEANLDVTDEDMASAARYERELRHDVMAHVHAWGDRCPKAKGIIHLGMTSQDVNDNCELLLITESAELITEAAERLVVSTGGRAADYRGTPTLGFTHYQIAQPTTVGCRLARWAHDFYDTSVELGKWNLLVLRGLRGATGTQASFLNLLNGDADAVDELEARFIWEIFRSDPYWSEMADYDDDTFEQQIVTEVGYMQRMSRITAGIRGEHADEAEEKVLDDEQLRIKAIRKIPSSKTWSLVGQTYPRIHDAELVSRLASIAAVLHKCATDLRLLCNRKEIDEPFEENQIGSSAMPYKRNPMRCERVCALARFVMNLVGNTYETAATQWLERTLDDSANRRLVLPEAFLATEACLNIMHNVISGLVVHEAQVKKNLMAELPFLATENILMEAVKAGGDRQHLHEVIRQHAQHVAWRIKQEGAENDLIERLREDPAFASVKDRLTEGDLLDPMKYIGRAVEQTQRFIEEVIAPLREEHDGDSTSAATELKV